MPLARDRTVRLVSCADPGGRRSRGTDHGRRTWSAPRPTPAFVTAALRETGVLDSATRSPRSRTSRSVWGSASSASWPASPSATRAGHGAPGTVILKMPSQFPENRAVGDHFNFYKREGRFYQQLGDKLPCGRRPATGTTSTPRRDLRAAARGPRRPHDDQPDRRHPRRPGRRGPGALARSTAPGGPPLLDGLAWMPRLDDPINLAAGQRYRDAWPLFVERIGDGLPTAAIELGERVKEPSRT